MSDGECQNPNDAQRHGRSHVIRSTHEYRSQSKDDANAVHDLNRLSV